MEKMFRAVKPFEWVYINIEAGNPVRKVQCGGRTFLAKYGRDNSGCFTKLGSRPHGKNLWKKISLGWENFQENIRWKVGRGIESDYVKIPGWMVVPLELSSRRSMSVLNIKMSRFVNLLWKVIVARRSGKC